MTSVLRCIVEQSLDTASRSVDTTNRLHLMFVTDLFSIPQALAYLTDIKSGHIHLCRVAGNTV